VIEVYAMRRANGDWFALERHGRLRVPLFRSSNDGMIARLRNFGMLLFEPVALDAKLLESMSPGSDSDVDFCIVKDPFASLKRSSCVERAQLALLMRNSNAPPNAPRNGNGLHRPALSKLLQSEWWN
jgi:hypothetical protein